MHDAEAGQAMRDPAGEPVEAAAVPPRQTR
jgi:hypothetical protein